MSYTVQYGTSRYDKVISKKKGKRKWIYLSVIAVVLLLSILFPAKFSVMRKHFLPFFEPEVINAFQEMTLDISEGAGVYDATAAFCREIIRVSAN